MSKPPKPTITAMGIAAHLQNIKDMAAQEMAARAAMEPPPAVDVRQLLLVTTGQELMSFMEPAEVFDACIVGAADVGDETVAVYNKLSVIAALAEHRGISLEEAFDIFTQSYGQNRKNTQLKNEAGETPPQMPLFLVDIRDLG